MCATLALATKALVGVQPVFTQVPPTYAVALDDGDGVSRLQEVPKEGAGGLTGTEDDVLEMTHALMGWRVGGGRFSASPV
jgi:hypothetical protein